MTNINQNPMNPQPRSKAPLVLFIVSILILIISGGYFVYAQSLSKTAKSTNDDTTPEVARLNNTVVNNTATANTTDQSSTATTQTPRDPNRYYNDEDRYSFVVPEGWKGEDLLFYSSKINEEKNLAGTCGNFASSNSIQIYQNFENKKIGDDFSKELTASLPGIVNADLRISDNNVKYALGIDICNGLSSSDTETASAIRFWTFMYVDEKEIILNYRIPSETMIKQNIEIKNLEQFANKVWQNNDNSEVQNLFGQYESIMASLKLE